MAKKMFLLGKNILFFSIEMPQVQCVRRLQASLSDIEYKKLKECCLDDTEKAKLDTTIKGLSAAQNYFKIIDAPDCTAAFIESKIREQKVKPDVVVVDYLGIVHSTGKQKDKWEANEANALALRILARKYGTVMLSAVQVNREGVKGDGMYYEMDDIAFCFAITMHTDMLLSMRISDPDMLQVSPIGQLNAKFLKNRDGEKKSFLIVADYSKFVMDEPGSVIASAA
jgi:replicative DNA helicase